MGEMMECKGYTERWEISNARSEEWGSRNGVTDAWRNGRRKKMTRIDRTVNGSMGLLERGLCG